MIYEYMCDRCGRKAERVCSVSERNEPFFCVDCGRESTRIPSFGGGLKTEHPAWLDDNARGAIQKPGEPPLTTRTEHDAYCERHGYCQR